MSNSEKGGWNLTSKLMDRFSFTHGNYIFKLEMPPGEAEVVLVLTYAFGDVSKRVFVASMTPNFKWRVHCDSIYVKDVIATLSVAEAFVRDLLTEKLRPTKPPPTEHQSLKDLPAPPTGTQWVSMYGDRGLWFEGTFIPVPGHFTAKIYETLLEQYRKECKQGVDIAG